jgi:hypothetical protein
MRMTPAFAIAAALLLTAAPAAAQNEATPANATETANTVDMNVAATNEVGATTTTDMNTLTTTETTSVPVAPMDTAPEPERKSFPWGVIGLLGLIGLIPRFRR